MSTTLSVLPIDYALVVPRGTASTINLTFETSTGGEVSLAGDTITMTARDAYGGTSKFTAAGSIVSSTAGTATITMTTANTDDEKTCGQTHWVYVITRTHAGVVTPWWGGRLTIDETAR